MRRKTRSISQASTLLAMLCIFMACDEKATQPADGFNVTNDNAHCGLVAGFVRNTSGNGLSGAMVSISPCSLAVSSNFINYPNPFTSNTYFAYYLSGAGQHAVTISIYDLHGQLQRQFPTVYGSEGAHQLLYFDGLDDQEEPLHEGLFPCQVLVQSTDGTDSLRIILSKGVNISDQGGLESYSVTTSSDGLYVIGEVPLNIMLLATTTFAPDQTLTYPENWPYVETGWTLTDRFIVTVNKTGYATVSDTVTLNPGGVTRLDMTLP